MAYAKRKNTYVNILEGRENIKPDEIMKKYPDGIHITGASVVKSRNGEVGAFIFKEDVDKFFFGGKVLTDMLNDWIKEAGNVSALNEKLPVDLPLMKLTWETSKTGNKYLDCEVIEQ